MADLLANKVTSKEENGEGDDGMPGLTSTSSEDEGNWKEGGAPAPQPPVPSNVSSSSSSSSSGGNVVGGGGILGGMLGKMPPPPSWDPSLAMENRHPTKECLCRIRNDMKSLLRDPLDGIYAIPDEVNATIVHAIVLGPFDTPYESGFFYFILNVPDNYPQEPPKVKLMTTGGGRVRFNPNLYANGKVCLSILGTWSGPSWVPVNTLSSVLLSIQSLMNEKPYHNEPGFEAPNSIACQNYNDCIRHETIRVAVCEMADDTSQRRSLPPKLRELVLSLFPNFFDTYEITCQSHLHRDGQNMIDPFGEKRGQFQYGTILSRLNKIRDSIEARYDEEEEDVEGGPSNGAMSSSSSSSSDGLKSAGLT